MCKGPSLLFKSLAILSLLFLPLFIHPYTPQVKAEGDTRKQEFAEFESEIYNLLKLSVEPLYELDHLQGEASDVKLYYIATSAEKRLTESASALTNLDAPNDLPNDIKGLLEQVKIDLTIGFTTLSESMNYFRQYLKSLNAKTHKSYMESRNKGFLYVSGGITELTTARLKFDPPKWWK